MCVRFRSKERGTRIKLTARQMAQVKERGGGGEQSKETLADKSRDFENHPLGLSCLSSHIYIWCCHQLSWLTNKMFGLAWSGNELNRMCVWNQKLFFVCILSHNVVLHSGCSFSLRCNPLFEIWMYKSLSIRENLTSCKKNNTNKLGSAWQNIAGNHRIPWQKKIAFSYSDPGDTGK